MLIVIEGTDSSGKETQTRILSERLDCRRVSFPNYESLACAPVKMYLAGEFGTVVEEINPYAVSTMYAIDRYASYKTDWGKSYENGETIIADRYVTSNMIHQASKISDSKEKFEFITWLEDLEYDKMGMPVPNIVIFLDMPPKTAQRLMAERKNKITGEDKKDIHELDTEYLTKSYHNAKEIAITRGWEVVSCVRGEEVRTIESIANEILKIVGCKLGVYKI